MAKSSFDRLEMAKPKVSKLAKVLASNNIPILNIKFAVDTIYNGYRNYFAGGYIILQKGYTILQGDTKCCKGIQNIASSLAKCLRYNLFSFSPRKLCNISFQEIYELPDYFQGAL